MKDGLGWCNLIKMTMADETLECPPHHYFIQYEANGKEVGRCKKCGIVTVFGGRLRFKPRHTKGRHKAEIGLSYFDKVEGGYD